MPFIAEAATILLACLHSATTPKTEREDDWADLTIRHTPPSITRRATIPAAPSTTNSTIVWKKEWKQTRTHNPCGHAVAPDATTLNASPCLATRTASPFSTPSHPKPCCPFRTIHGEHSSSPSASDTPRAMPDIQPSRNHPTHHRSQDTPPQLSAMRQPGRGVNDGAPTAAHSKQGPAGHTNLRRSSTRPQPSSC